MPDAAAALVRARLDDYAALASVVASDRLADQVTAVGRVLLEAYRSEGRLLLIGNGGSAADASHVAAEFVGRCTVDREPLAALSLAENLATVTAIANDYGFDQVFVRQIEAHASTSDVVMALTTSGRSPNVVAALKRAQSIGVTTVLLSAGDGGDAVAHADHALLVPHAHTGRAQEVHLLWCHIWAELVERSLRTTER